MTFEIDDPLIPEARGTAWKESRPGRWHITLEIPSVLKEWIQDVEKRTDATRSAIVRTCLLKAMKDDGWKR